MRITPTEVPGQLPQQQYGFDADGRLYLYSPTYGEWWPENDATRIAREARAAGRGESQAAVLARHDRNRRRGQNWMTRQRAA